VEKDLQIFASIASQAAVAIHNSNLAREIEQEAKTRAQFQRLLSPNLVDQVVTGKLQLEKGGALSEVTMLFSDIRGFTSMSESRAPQEIVRLLNEYFELMVDVLFKYEGTLDKFVGDEIVALFGAPVPMPKAELKAVECALDMMKALKEFNRLRLNEGQEEIKIGIGINTGTVVTGAIGSSRALQYTAIGDPVNTASRLCSIAKPGEIILSDGGRATADDIQKGGGNVAWALPKEGALSWVCGLAISSKADNVDAAYAFINDVLHHIEHRAEYLKNLAAYLKPGGRIAVIDFIPELGGHRTQPELQVTQAQTTAWMEAAGLKAVEEIKGLFTDKWFVIYAKP
jgi:class 3 adenylate cyclase